MVEQLSKSNLWMQAQIAMANTALTTLGMWILQIPGIGLLGLFVFICSFIPIAGVFISTVPIAFVALTEYGFVKVSSAPGCCPSVRSRLPFQPIVFACLPPFASALPATLPHRITKK